MIYEIKHFDTAVLKFSADNGADSNIKLLWVNEEKKQFIPLDLSEISSSGIEAWIKHRTIPKNRAYVNTILNKMGLSINRPMGIIKVSKGVSLNDCFWVAEENSTDTFDKINLYENRFNNILGIIAFTGYGSLVNTSLASSPEFTTNGMLPKCWRRNSGTIQLWKGATEGASNTGFEPYSEFYASQIGKILGIDIIDYDIKKWKGRICSVCDLFTSKNISFVPVGRIVYTGGMKAVRKFYEELGEKYVKSLNDMILFDAVIFNTDRHFGNFGFLIDNNTNQIIAPAPLFDHGNSLFNLASLDTFENENNMKQYAENTLPCVYDDFVEEAKKNLTHEQKNNLRKLLNFKFKRHSRYNLQKNRISLIEKTVSDRVTELLK